MFCAQLMDWEAETSDQGQASPCAAYKGALPWAGTHFFGLFLPFIHSRMCSWKLSPIFRGLFFFFHWMSSPCLLWAGAARTWGSGRGALRVSCGWWGDGQHLRRPVPWGGLQGWGEAMPWGGPQGWGEAVPWGAPRWGKRSPEVRSCWSRVQLWGEAAPWGPLMLRCGGVWGGALPWGGFSLEEVLCCEGARPWGVRVSWGAPSLHEQVVVHTRDGASKREEPWAVVALASLLGLPGSWAVAAGWALQGAG